MERVDEISIIIPSFNPSESLERVVKGLIEVGFNDIIIVNDGSSAVHTEPFERLRKLTECTVLAHPKNKGKGAALKTALRFFEENRTGGSEQNSQTPAKVGVVTVDGDGQHLANEVLKCANLLLTQHYDGESEKTNAVILGTRDFSNPTVPGRNSFGNRLSVFAFRFFLGIKLRDTQTGLRGIPTRLIPMILKIDGKRFEYETNMLIELNRQGVAFIETDVETVYEKGSTQGSHFRPLIDSLMIFARLFKYTLSSLLSFLVDISIFGLVMTFFGASMGSWSILGSTVIARLVSSFVNFNLNRRLVFRRETAYRRHLLRYYTIAAAQMLASAGTVWVLSLLLGAGGSTRVLMPLKILVDTGLFFLSYYFQSKWVFKS